MAIDMGLELPEHGQPVIAQRFDHLLGRLTEGLADGALVRLSTPIEDGGEFAARSRLVSFARILDPEIERHWPIEVPVR